MLDKNKMHNSLPQELKNKTTQEAPPPPGNKQKHFLGSLGSWKKWIVFINNTLCS